MKRILRSHFFWILLCAVCLSIPIGRRWLIARHYEEADRKASEVRKEYAAQMRSKLPGYFKDMTYLMNAEVRASSELIYHQIHKECRMDSVTITLRVVNGFDRLSDNEQYDYLCDFARKGEQAIRSVVQRNVPDYKEARSDFWNAARDYKDI